MKQRFLLPILAGALALGGCQDLTVPNENTPSLEQVFSNGEDLENAVGTQFRIVWGVAQGSRTNSTYPVLGLAALGEELTSANLYPFNVASEPRSPLDNRDAGQWVNRKPWYDLYEAIATSTDALTALENGIKVGAVTTDRPNGAHAGRARIFAKFIQGLGHIYIGMLFDKGWTRDETLPINPATGRFVDEAQNAFKPYKEVTAFGIAKLEEAIALAGTLPLDTFPTTWINGFTPTTSGLIPVMNSYIARAMVYSARNPQERAAVDWAKVIQYLDKGIKTSFAQQASTSITGTTSAYLQYTQLMTDARVDNLIVGYADTSGAFQTWLATPLAQRPTSR